ncbi:MAG: ribonuclease III [Ignavibacteria bacterium]|jgi:ribonuclease-3|nr:ribonuclease III [Ignavibacteria bacterium]
MKDILHTIYAGLKKKITKNQQEVHTLHFPRIGVLNDERIHNLERTLNCTINNPAFFEQALTHRSYLQIAPQQDIHSNERLEFLGDAILGMIVAEYVFYHHFAVQEGELTKLRSWIVQRNSLAHVAKSIGLDTYIQLSPSAGKSLKDGNDTMLADLLEAIIAAIYLDSGMEQTKKFIGDILIPAILHSPEMQVKNYKSILLEIVQADGFFAPRYIVQHESGPDHDKNFTVAVFVDDKEYGVGSGKNKKQAEQKAAKDALDKHYPHALEHHA